MGLLEAQNQTRFRVFRWTYRFFTGLHLDGKIRKPRRGPVFPRYSNYFWNRYSRSKRALIRNIIFWFGLAIGYGLLVDQGLTEFLLLAASPFFCLWGFFKVVNSLTMVTSWTDSDGNTEKYRILRPRVRKWLKVHKPSKLRISLPDGGPVEPDIERAMLADNAESNGEPITGLRQLQLMQGEDVTDTPVKGRARTIRRAVEKRRKVG